MVHFLRELQDRAQLSGWTDVLEVPPDLTLPDVVILLTQAYGQLTLQQVRARTVTYYVRYSAQQGGAGLDKLYTCLVTRLTQEGYDLVKLILRSRNREWHHMSQGNHSRFAHRY